MTECGNFCFIGYNTGHLDLYNLQSGIHRGSYVDHSQTALLSAHKKSIAGIAVDGLNQVCINFYFSVLRNCQMNFFLYSRW